MGDFRGRAHVKIAKRHRGRRVPARGVIAHRGYAIFETGPEKRLLAFTPDAAMKVEQLFWAGDGTTPGLYRQIADKASVESIRQSREALDGELETAQATLQAGTAPAAIVFNSATIVFREGWKQS